MTLKMHKRLHDRYLQKKISCLDSAFKGLDSLTLVSAIKGQRLDGAIFFYKYCLQSFNVLKMYQL